MPASPHKTPTPQPPTRRANRAAHLGPARRRESILAAAAGAFADGGFEGASMAKIAEAAGIAKPVVYDAFPGGKQELYYAILDRGQASFVAYLSAVLERGRGLPLDESLRAGLKGFLDYAEHEPAAFRVIFGSAGTTNPEIARRTEAVREEVVRTMTDRTMDTLGLAETVRPAAEVYIRGIVAVAEELARWTARRPDLSRDVLVDLVVAWFMRGFDGVLGLGSPGDPSGLPAS